MHPAALCNKNAPQINSDNPARQHRLANVKADGAGFDGLDMQKVLSVLIEFRATSDKLPMYSGGNT